MDWDEHMKQFARYICPVATAWYRPFSGVSTIVPRISAKANICYATVRTRRLNKTCIFWSPALYRLFQRYMVDLWCSLIAAHLRGFRAFPAGDLRPRQRWPSSAPLSSSIWSSKRPSLDERQQEIAWQTDRLMQIYGYRRTGNFHRYKIFNSCLGGEN